MIERDPLRQILEFSFDSIQLELIRRRVRTLAPVIPEHGSVCLGLFDILSITNCLPCNVTYYACILVCLASSPSPE